MRKINYIEVTGISRGGGRPKKTWIETITDDFKSII